MEKSDDLDKQIDSMTDFVNFISQHNVSVNPITVYRDHDHKKTITSENIADGLCPECVNNFQFTWLTNEKIANEIGNTLAELRLASQQYSKDQPEKVKEA